MAAYSRCLSIMNLNVYTFRLQSLLTQAKNILLLVSREPNIDKLASSLALYLSLSQKGKQVSIVCPDKMTVAYSHLFAVDKVKDELGGNGKNLVISFPYVEGSIEKVSYNIENNKFNLVIEPRAEENIIASETVEFSTSGNGENNFDLVITIGVTDLSDLGKFQQDAQKLFSGRTVVTINNTQSNLSQSTLNIINTTNVSISEMVTILMSKINLPIDQDIAGNLLKGIKEKTQNFQRGSADSFEAAAICLRKMPETKPTGSIKQVMQQSQTIPIQKQASEVKKAPPDWLKPKIFRSSNPNIADDHNKDTLL